MPSRLSSGIAASTSLLISHVAYPKLHISLNAAALAFLSASSTAMDFAEPDAETPLLYDNRNFQESSSSSYRRAAKPSPVAADTGIGSVDYVHRSVEDDVVPETAVLGRNLGWSSAYILIISRVIGSGIFATPGAIVSSVGSIGLSLLLWLAGALISWCGLVASLEYGCMLPRSGG